MLKRGQVTVFMIIGILMLLLFAGLFYFTRSSITEKITSEGQPVTESVPLAFTPVKTYTENCIATVGKKGLVILGQQGGYIYPSLLGEYSATKPVESIGLNLEPMKIPYWHYNIQPSSADKVSFASLQPKLYEKDDAQLSIEAQLKKYVKEKLDNCLDNYSAFHQQGFAIEQDSKTVQVTVKNKTVDFSVKLPLKIKKGEATAEMSFFYVQIPLRLQQYYETASKITQAENNFTFLERQALNLISSFSGVDMKRLPPMSATTFELASTFSWEEKQVERKVKQLLNSYLPMLRYLGSNNFYDYIFPDSKLSHFYQGMYDQMVIPLKGADNININFNYFNWPIYLKTNSQDGIIKPSHFFVNYQLLRIGSQDYETNYDLSYPVLVTLRDESAFGGEGYNFVFALEGNIKNNKPASEKEEIISLVPTASKLACKKEHWDTGLLKTVVVDSFSKKPVEQVKIGFSIPEQEACEIGFTDIKGTIESKYPTVYGGIISFMKTGYLTDFYPIDTYKYKGKKEIIGYAAKGVPEKVVELHKYHKINVSIKKKNLEKCVTPLVCQYTSGASELLGGVPFKDISCEKGKEQCFFNSGNNLFAASSASSFNKPLISLESNGSLSRYGNYYFKNTVKSLSENESAVILLRRVSGLDLLTSSEFTVSLNLNSEESKLTDLVPGIYEVSLTLYSDQEFKISKEQRCISYDILTWKSEECFSMNSTKLDKRVSGQVNWDTSSTYLKVTPEDLYNSQQLELFVLAQNLDEVPETIKTISKKCAGFLCLPGLGCVFDACKDQEIKVNGRVIEDLQVFGSLANVSRMDTVRLALEPRFS